MSSLFAKCQIKLFCPKFWDVNFACALEYLKVSATSFMCLCLLSFDQGEADDSCGIEVLQINVYFAEIDKAFL